MTFSHPSHSSPTPLPLHTTTHRCRQGKVQWKVKPRHSGCLAAALPIPKPTRGRREGRYSLAGDATPLKTTELRRRAGVWTHHNGILPTPRLLTGGITNGRRRGHTGSWGCSPGSSRHSGRAVPHIPRALHNGAHTCGRTGWAHSTGHPSPDTPPAAWGKRECHLQPAACHNLWHACGAASSGWGRGGLHGPRHHHAPSSATTAEGVSPPIPAV